jgi:hypothetical protein
LKIQQRAKFFSRSEYGMKKEIGLTSLAVLGALLGSASEAQTTVQNSQEAASVIKSLQEQGYVRIDQSGKVTLRTSVLEVLKDAGIATWRDHSALESSSCHSTVGGCASSD